MTSPSLTSVISEFARTILNPYDLQQLLHELTDQASALTGAQGAGIMLAGRSDGELGFAAASDERILAMEVIQDRVQEGACYEAFLDNQLIVVEDLERSGRWPAYEKRAAQLGLRSVLAVPMNAWGQTIGVLNIYREHPGPWSPDEVEAAQVITSMGSGYVLHANQIRAQHDLADQLQTALESRDVIGQAKGVLMHRDGLSAETAFDQLRKISQERNVKLRDVAHHVVTAECPSQQRTRTNRTVPDEKSSSTTTDLEGSPLLGDPDGDSENVGSTTRTDHVSRYESKSAQQRDEAARSRDSSALSRDEAAEQRDEVADRRDAESDLREQTGESGGHGEAWDTSGGGEDGAVDGRDAAAEDRDQAADERDRAAEQRDQTARTVESSLDIVTAADAKARKNAVSAREHAASDRRAAARDRRQATAERTAAGLDRDASAADRVASAQDRRHAAQDRAASATDRTAAAKELNTASMDALTGAYARGPGMAELERDRARADRNGEPMTLAFVDVDDLTGTNERGGHPAGDRLLRQVAEVLTEHTRSHDVIVRYGGDEFVCALMGLTRAEAAKRLAEVNAALAEASEGGSVTVGLAELEPTESLSSLIRRADADLYHQRRQR